MARIYAEENFALPVVEHLRQLGHDVLTARDAGEANRKVPDPVVLEYAVNDGRALLSFNRLYFIRLHKTGIKHNGIVVCTFDIDFLALAQRIHEGVSSSGDLSGKLLRITRPHRAL